MFQPILLHGLEMASEHRREGLREIHGSTMAALRRVEGSIFGEGAGDANRLDVQVEITILKRQGFSQSLSGSGQHEEERIVARSFLQDRRKEVLPLDLGHRFDLFLARGL
ncbi:MAG TPA: hypothetical protein DCQ94_11540 [Nitrospira sp.]|nr:hypothetical protein [Nitrospira sp.]